MKTRKVIRLQNYDYRSDGYYFVTIVSKLRHNVFLNKESFLEGQLIDLETKTQGLKVDYYVVMPNHLHIILILQNSKLHLGEIVRRFKAKVSHKWGENIWQANYYEHVIRNEKALAKIRECIANNPQGLLLKFVQFYESFMPINRRATY